VLTNPANVLKTHSASWMKGQLPPIEVVTRYVEKGDDASDHWVWLVDLSAKNPRRLSSHGQAVLSWASNARISRGLFSVARLLIEHHKGPFPERSVFDLQCGLTRCVNPDHWKWREPIPRYRFDLTSEGWRVAERRTAKPVQQRVLLSVRDQHGVTHLVPAAPHHVSRYVALCETIIAPEVTTVLAMNAVITCKGGC
jgi:hypothetical protein